VEPLDPADLEATFGAGVRLEQVEISITEDTVTYKIGNRLPDFGASSGYSEWLRQLPYNDPRFINKEDIIMRE
jgi:hypothetical protein